MEKIFDEVNHNDCETMTREEFMDERRELGLDIDPQANEDDDCYEYGYSSNDTFNFILECDREIFEDFLSWASRFLNAETEGEQHVGQIFKNNLGINLNYPISVIEIFNIWFYESERVVYWICDDHVKYTHITQQEEAYLTSDISDTRIQEVILPIFIYRRYHIVAEVFFITAPCDDESHCIQQRSVWGNKKAVN